MLGEGTHVVGYDPVAGSAALVEVPALELAVDPYEAATGAHCVTAWDEFRELGLHRLGSRMASKNLVDGRNLLDAAAASAAGIAYRAMGRPDPSGASGS